MVVILITIPLCHRFLLIFIDCTKREKNKNYTLRTVAVVHRLQLLQRVLKIKKFYS